MVQSAAASCSIDYLVTTWHERSDTCLQTYSYPIERNGRTSSFLVFHCYTVFEERRKQHLRTKLLPEQQQKYLLNTCKDHHMNNRACIPCSKHNHDIRETKILQPEKPGERVRWKKQQPLRRQPFESLPTRRSCRPRARPCHPHIFRPQFPFPLDRPVVRQEQRMLLLRLDCWPRPTW